MKFLQGSLEYLVGSLIITKKELRFLEPYSQKMS